MTLLSHIMTLCAFICDDKVFSHQVLNLGCCSTEILGTVRDKFLTQLQRVVAHMLHFEQCLDAVWPLQILCSHNLVVDQSFNNLLVQLWHCKL